MSDVASASRVSSCVSEAITEVNTLRPGDDQIPTDPDTVLLGDGGRLDSLAFVNLAVALEAALEREFGAAVGIVGELLGAEDPNSFRTVGLLIDFVAVRASVPDA